MLMIKAGKGFRRTGDKNIGDRMLNESGNLISKTDRNGNTINYTYDSLNRLTVKAYPDATTTNYSYDLNGNMLSVSNSDITYTFSYDAIGRVTQVQNVTLAKTISYAYLCCDLKSGMTDSEGGKTSYTYDALKRLTSLTNPYGETTNYTYDNLSRVIRKNLANGSYTNYTYDVAGRLVSLTNKGSDDSVISSYIYTIDNIGNRTSMTRLSGIHNYNYDKIYQLLKATHPISATEQYTYDPVYNRLTSADYSNWTYDNNNRLISYNNVTYTYDSNGNITSKTDTVLSEVTSYQYDYENRLKTIDYPDGTYSEYRYDPFGNRIKKDVNGSITWFVYDLMKGPPDVIMEYDGAGSLLASYTHGPEIDDIISMRRDGNSYYYFKDALGSITALSNNNEVVVNSYQYDAFGDILDKTELVMNPYGFTERRIDNESGLMYYRARYYDPKIGRFLSPDPTGFSNSELNLYRYAQNNPVNFTDPYGLYPLPPNHPECIGLRKKIENLREKVLKRRGELKEDIKNLPERCPGDVEKPSLSRWGHRKLLNIAKRNLAAREAEYAWKCGGGPPIPAPTPEKEPSPGWEVPDWALPAVIGVGVTVLILTPWPDDIIIVPALGGAAL